MKMALAPTERTRFVKGVAETLVRTVRVALFVTELAPPVSFTL